MSNAITRATPSALRRAWDAARAWGVGLMTALIPSSVRDGIATQYVKQASLRETWGALNASRLRSARTTETPYKNSSWVYICVSRNALAASAIPWRVVSRRAGKWSADPAHPLNALISDGPNIAWGWQDLIERSLQSLQLTGNALLRVTRRVSDNAPSEIWTANTVDAGVELADGWIARYLYHPWGSTATRRSILAAEDAIHIQLPDPGCIFWGLSPLQAAARAVDTDIEAAASQQESMERVFSPPGIVSIDADSMTDVEVTAMRERFVDHYTGRDNAGIPLFLGRGAKFSPLYLSPKEMHFLESRRMTREEITGIYGTPPTVAGILEYSSYANVGALYRQWYDGTLCPMLGRFAHSFNRQYVAANYGDDVKLEFDKSQVPELVESLAGAASVAEALARLGYTRDTINDRLALGMPADAPYPSDASSEDAPS